MKRLTYLVLTTSTIHCFGNRNRLYVNLPYYLFYKIICKTSQPVTFGIHLTNVTNDDSLDSVFEGLTNLTRPLCRAGRPGNQRLGVCKEAKHCQGGSYQGFCRDGQDGALGVCCFGKKGSFNSIPNSILIQDKVNY